MAVSTYPRLRTHELVSDLTAHDRRQLRRLFANSFLIRLATIVLLVTMTGSLHEISRDSMQYHMQATDKAAQYASGNIQWYRWIDDGWYEFCGVLYWIFGSHLIVLLLANVLMVSYAVTLLYRSALLITGSSAIATFSASLFAFFPSIVYYTSLPLKESAALVGILSIILGCILSIRGRVTQIAVRHIVVGLLIMLAIRAYLVPILLCSVVGSIMASRGRSGMQGLVQLTLAFVMVAGAFYFAIVAINPDLLHHEAFSYYDFDKINEIRAKLTRGNSRMYSSGEEATFGGDVVSDFYKLVRGIFFFFVSIDVFNVANMRQLAALPEAIFIVMCIPYLIAGVRGAVRTRLYALLPVVLIACVVVAVYGSAATNIGAINRWRLQALPLLIIIMTYGAAVRGRGILYTFLLRFRPARGELERLRWYPRRSR